MQVTPTVIVATVQVTTSSVIVVQQLGGTGSTMPLYFTTLAGAAVHQQHSVEQASACTLLQVYMPRCSASATFRDQAVLCFSTFSNIQGLPTFSGDRGRLVALASGRPRIKQRGCRRVVLASG
ncbi:hypothetical protein TRIUR3_10068 [Triticum urartu]|uniref:Uncharacterized protein n=1 Tax=Triticum urartu TaxID=4572 RepID=M8AAF2_TRIUA|nr:hypothetical protein TRIUR3_10068 [Triticum urartu]